MHELWNRKPAFALPKSILEPMPMANVVELKTRPAQINEGVVNLLREVLAGAERGEIIGVAIAPVEPSGASRVEVAQNECFHGLLGAVMLMQHRMCARHIGDDI